MRRTPKRNAYTSGGVGYKGKERTHYCQCNLSDNQRQLGTSKGTNREVTMQSPVRSSEQSILSDSRMLPSRFQQMSSRR